VHSRKSPVVKQRDHDGPSPHPDKSTQEAYGGPDYYKLENIKEGDFHLNFSSANRKIPKKMNPGLYRDSKEWKKIKPFDFFAFSSLLPPC
jgi:hypothetical protein